MNRKGFSLVELMISVVVLGIVMAAVVTMMINSDKAKRKNESLIEAQQQGSAAMEMLVRDIRSAGYEVATLNEQPIIAYAMPFEIIFNTNLNPFPDSLGLKQPRAYDPGISPLCPNYTIGATFTGGAETYRYTLDSNHDGIFGVADRIDDAVELRTRNPDDYVLIRQTYGRMDDNTNNVYPNRNFDIALVRGPVAADDQDIIPMFQYWYRDVVSNVLVLWGDTDGDEVLTGVERLFANPPQNILMSIEMITITVTTETRIPVDRNQYRRVVVSTTTNLANVPNTKAKYGITGKLKDESGGGIAGGKVYLSTGSIQTSNGSGDYTFAVENGIYVVTPEKLINSGSYFYVLKNPQDSSVTVADADAPNVDFRYQSISSGDMRDVGGKVYNDSIVPIGVTPGVPPAPDTDERGITGVVVAVKGKPTIADSTILNISTTTDALGDYRFTLPQGIYTITEIDSPGYYSTTPNIVVDTLGATDNLNVNFGDSRAGMGTINIKVWNDADKDSTLDTGEPGLGNVFCMVVNTNNGDLAGSGRTDANGDLVINLPGDSLYTVMEIDPDSMISTCGLFRAIGSTSWSVASTLNQVDSLFVPKDSTRYVMFGDVVGYVAIPLGQTERVLSMILPDLREYREPPGDRNNPLSYSADPDIVLGTVNTTGAVSNLLVWYNRYQSSATPASALFPTAFDSSANLTTDITALAGGDINSHLGSTTEDVICGLKENVGAFNISVGRTHDGGLTGANFNRDKGLMRDAVLNYATSTPVSNTSVLALGTGNLTPTTLTTLRLDFAAGTKVADNEGRVEIWKSNSATNNPPTFTLDTVIATAGGGTPLGEVRALLLMDVVDSTGTLGSDLPNNYQDLIIATKTGSFPTYTGQLVIYRRAGLNKRFIHQATYNISDGYINALGTYRSRGTSFPNDIICGLRTNGSTVDDYKGRLSLWYNNNDGTFGSTGAPNVSRVTEGEVLCLSANNLNIDYMIDVAVGLKFGEYTGGTRFYYNTSGSLALAGSDPSGGKYTGEVVTIRSKTLRPYTTKVDVVVGERFLSGGVGYGRVIIYHHKY
ncbi:MAG: prepilin-type N-terminal cleavage/methylation domain-containing protein [Candidatus Edwardsbacteria bacterium]|nr:prepilin-type N-terminal cleavage/methylation domain-containing protein [Candidatus Edwardsbacteria bacterium]MBU1577551.1 prepilin-type N-terminal cleavage/methylation domain-containing protein [Candidatus Edwardsbacteria bacterium]MBU2462511.1 prepilin-type N-terminal cleavage/methylation domain-containing protein [Candidatus Edwardsbacteria bacterium]MBU2593646.1 prepilin-type N-terminal cleavage/methylation domain-containing protein [Candidatus Edwardsbacteria bacterium]